MAQPQPPIQPPVPRKKRLLVAEAVSARHDVKKTFFQRRGFHVMIAPDGLAAIAMARSEAPDAIVLSAEMDGIAGDQVCRSLKTDPSTKSIPVAVWCEWGDEATRQKFDMAGTDAFIPRSEGREALLQAVAGLLKIPARKNARMTVLFSVLNEEGARETLGKAYEIGEGGLGIEVTRPYGLGEAIRLRFRLPGEKTDIQAKGQVRWVAPRGAEVFGMGIEFVEISDECQTRLNTYMDRALAMV